MRLIYSTWSMGAAFPLQMWVEIGHFSLANWLRRRRICEGFSFSGCRVSMNPCALSEGKKMMFISLLCQNLLLPTTGSSRNRYLDM